MMIIEPPSTRFIPVLSIVTLLFACTAMPHAQTSPAPHTKWTLTWSDEFGGAAGSAPDPTKWAFDKAGDAFNGELESYTSNAANVQQKNGDLVITALREDTVRPDGTTRHYTSGRIFTKDIFSQTYGRFEASIKLPLGKGVWPAFWLLGSDIEKVSWPASGEVDIFENIGEPAIIYSTIHGPGYNGAKGISAKHALPVGQAVNTAFHLYAIEWAPNEIKFFLDDHLIAKRTPADLPPGSVWAFNHPFFILLNLAVGGAWPGNPDQTTNFPQKMLVDYVRVYNQTIQPVDAAGVSAQASAQGR